MVIDITHFFLCVVRYCWLPCLFLVEVLCHRKDKNEDTFFITGELINKKSFVNLKWTLLTLL